MKKQEYKVVVTMEWFEVFVLDATSKKEAEAAMRGQQPVNEPVDAAEPDNPDEVIYAGEQGEAAPKKKKRKKSGTIMTSTTGVMGDAPTESKTLLGG